VSKLFFNLALDYEFWLKIYDDYKIRNNKILEELKVIFKRFYDFKIEKVFITENFAALLSSGNDIALFASGDVDVFAEKLEKDKIYSAFESMGYILEERYSDNILINSSFSKKNQDFYISISWELLSRTKLPSFVSIDDFLNWEKVFYYNNSYIKLPDKNSLMYIVCLHMSLHSYTRAPHIRLFADISNSFVLDPDLDWILRISKKNSTVNRVNIALMLSNKFIQTPLFIENKLSRKSKNIVKKLTIKSGKELVIEPKRFKIFLLEILFSDNNLFKSIKEIFFPPYDWVSEKYSKKETCNKLPCYLRHIKGLF
jgi:hypothetical protein